MLSFLHLQTHGHRFELRHTRGQLVGGESQIEGYRSTSIRALQGSLIEERQLIGGFLPLIAVEDNTMSIVSVFHLFNI